MKQETVLGGSISSNSLASCVRKSLSKTIFSRGFRMKYSWGEGNPGLPDSNYFKKKKWRHDFYLHISNMSLR